MTENRISYIVRGVSFNIYNQLGPGLLESIYERALYHVLLNEGFEVRSQVKIPVIFNDIDLGIGYRIDLLVENKVIVEIKFVEELSNLHKKQLLTYLKLTGKKLGLLINFNSTNLNQSIVRIVNDL